MSNLEEDIKFIEKMIKEYKTFGDLHNPDFEDTDRIYKVLENMLKRIKELEEEKKNRADFQQKYIEVTNLYLNSIPKQKVEDKKKEIKKTGQYLYTNVDVCNILDELVEEK